MKLLLRSGMALHIDSTQPHAEELLFGGDHSIQTHCTSSAVCLQMQHRLVPLCACVPFQQCVLLTEWPDGPRGDVSQVAT